MQIHHLTISRTEHYVLDEELGVVRRKEQAVRRSDVEQVVHEGKTYEIDPDGSFHVPEAVGRFMLRLPDWHPGPSPFQDQIVAVEEAKVPRRRPAGV